MSSVPLKGNRLTGDPPSIFSPIPGRVRYADGRLMLDAALVPANEAEHSSCA